MPFDKVHTLEEKCASRTIFRVEQNLTALYAGQSGPEGEVCLILLSSKNEFNACLHCKPAATTCFHPRLGRSIKRNCLKPCPSSGKEQPMMSMAGATRQHSCQSAMIMEFCMGYKASLGTPGRVVARGMYTSSQSLELSRQADKL